MSASNRMAAWMITLIAAIAVGGGISAQGEEGQFGTPKAADFIVGQTTQPMTETEQPKPTKEDRAMGSTKDVLDHHLKSFDAGDLNGILSDYAPDAVLFTQGGPLRGTDAIRPLFQAMFAEFGKPGAAFSLKQQSIEGEVAYILWTAETADNVYEMATDTFVVRDGKIVAQSFAGKITPKG